MQTAAVIGSTIDEDAEVQEEDFSAEDTPREPEPVAVSKYSEYDPRVTTPLDQPNAVFRIKLICTLLEAVSHSIVTKNNLPKMEGFLAAFQRYLFTKTILPTEIEFALLDTFDLIDSYWRKVLHFFPSERFVSEPTAINKLSR